ncbi:MAG: DNA polymerase phi [Bacteriophage sp.]|nr:MAG: DNA polymerase phi [Bacteriophage sp.]
MKTLQNLFRKCGNIMKVICTRNNAEFELVSKDGDDITLKDLNSGKERIVNRKSYERFYKEVEEEVVEEVEDLEEEETEEEVDEEASEDSEEEEVEDADEDTVEDCEEEDEESEEEPEPVKPVKRGTKKAEAKKEPKPKKEKKVKEPKAPRQISPLKDVVETIVKAAGCTIFVTRVKGFHTIKLDGHMCMAFTFSTKGIVLWLRTKALDGLNIEYKTMKHMFDARISLTEDNEKTANLIRKCVAASVEYQKGVNTRKAQKAEALEAARQKKLEKEEQKKKEAIAEKLGVKPKKAAKKASKKVETPEVEAEALEDEEE